MVRTMTRVMKLVGLAATGYVMAAGCVSNSILPQASTANGLNIIPNLAGPEIPLIGTLLAAAKLFLAGQ